VTKLFKSSLFIGSVAICFSAMMWGLDGIVLTPQLYNLNIGFVVFIVHFVPFIIMNVFLYKQYRHLKELSVKEIFLLFLVALTGGALGTMAIVKALFLVNFQDLSVVVLLQKLQPIFAITLAYFFLHEKMRERFFLWSGIAIVASYFLTFGLERPNFTTGPNTALAAGYSIIAAFAFGSATVLGKSVLKKLSYYAATFYRYGFTSIIMAIFLIISGHLLDFSQVTTQNWIIIFIISITVGSGAIFLYYYGLRKVPAMLATICELCFPLSAIVFDYLFNDRLLSTVQWISAAVMIYSIIRLTLSPQITKQK
jgi:drug/metabolite transporter (DMT)-like permease